MSACSRALMSMMRELGYQIGRFKVRNLMKEAGQVAVGITWQRCLTCTPGGSWAGRCLINLMQNWQSKPWRWPISSGVAHLVCYFTLTRAANMAVGHFGNECGAIA